MEQAQISTVKRTGKAAEKPELPITPKQWERFLGLIAEGVPSREALDEVGLPTWQFKGKVLVSPEHKAQYEEAQLMWVRRNWPQDLIETLCSDIARGGLVKDVCARHNVSLEGFYNAVMKDPDYFELYDRARQIQMEGMVDDILEVSDDDSGDEMNGRPNNAAINRARLKADSRKWLMSKLHYRRFGDKIQQDTNVNMVVDTAGRLEEARLRKEEGRKRILEQKKS